VVTEVALPPALRGIFFTHRWENCRIWALPTPTTTVPLKNLVWHLELPVWTTVPGEPRFDLSPNEVIKGPELHQKRWQRIHSVDLSHPLELLKNGERWVIVDGYHRLARHHREGRVEVPVRMHGDECWASVLTKT
jgi:hypothetical protein